jgi:SulP family sulfate permease
MVDFRQLAFHLRATKYDAGVVIVTALAALVVSVEFCIVVGVFLSFVLFVSRAAHVRMARLTFTSEKRIREKQPGDPDCDRLLLFGLEGELFFGAEPELQKHFLAIEQAAVGNVRVVILLLKWARNPDAAFLNLLTRLDRRLGRRNVTFLISGVQSDLSKALAGTGADSGLGAHRIFCDGSNNGSSAYDAVKYAYGLLGDSLCATCPQRQGTSRTDGHLDYVI